MNPYFSREILIFMVTNKSKTIALYKINIILFHNCIIILILFHNDKRCNIKNIKILIQL